MTLRFSLAWALLLACSTWGCKDNQRNERRAASYSSVSKPTYLPVPSREPAKVAAGIDAIPAEEDYEERAATTITKENLVSRLVELEKEMAF